MSSTTKKTPSNEIGMSGSEAATQCSASAPEAQTRLSSAPTVANCIDTIKVSLWVEYEYDFDLIDRLDNAKKKAQEDDVDSYPVEIGGLSWNCMRIGTKFFSYRLIRGDIRLLVSSRDSKSPIANTRLEIGSLSCWVPGYLKVFETISQMFSKESGAIIMDQVTEIHLAADFIDLALDTIPIYEQDLWISKAHYSTNNFYRRKFNAVTIGRGDIMLRIYDKVLELRHAKHKQHFFKKIWGLKSYNEKAVTRVEFQLRRPVLKTITPTVSEFDDLKNGLASAWQYCTNEWCRLALKPVDRDNKHQSRQKVHPWWKTVQDVKWEGKDFDYRVIRQDHKDIRRNRACGVGNYMTVAASFGCKSDDIDEITIFARKALAADLREKYLEDRAEFERKMECKRNETAGLLDKRFKPLRRNE